MMKKPRALSITCIIASLLIAAPCAFGAQVYVAANGDNAAGDGSLARPFRTLYKAGTAARAGDTVYVRGGVYPATYEFIHVTSGTAAAPVTFTPYPGEQVILDGQGAPASSWTMVTINQSSHVVFDGFELRNANNGLMSVVDSTDVTVRNCQIHDARQHGLTMSGQQLVAEHNQVWNVALVNTGNSTGAGGVWPSAMNSLPISSGASSQNVTFRNNLVHDVWGEGIGVYQTDGAVVSGNTVHDSFSVNIYLSQARNVRIEGNYLYALNGEHNRSGLPATGILMATEPNYVNPQAPPVMLQNITIANNVIVGAGYGLGYFYSMTNVVPENTYQDIHIDFNVIRATQGEPLHFLPVRNNSLPPSGVTVRNNIFEQGANGQAVFLSDPSAWSFAYNDWPGGIPAVAAEPHSLAVDPTFVNPQLGGPADGFRLQGSSPVIGRGQPVPEVTADYSGISRNSSQPSLGVFEYIPDPVSTPATSLSSRADCVFDWAERTYPALLAPSGGSSTTAGQYYYRHYLQTGNYLGASSADGNLYYLDPSSGGSLLNLGPLTNWASTARCS